MECNIVWLGAIASVSVLILAARNMVAQSYMKQAANNTKLAL